MPMVDHSAAFDGKSRVKDSERPWRIFWAMRVRSSVDPLDPDLRLEPGRRFCWRASTPSRLTRAALHIGRGRYERSRRMSSASRMTGLSGSARPAETIRASAAARLPHATYKDVGRCGG
jgi:hypothetical protein